jgi:hypothetical protein
MLVKAHFISLSVAEPCFRGTSPTTSRLLIHTHGTMLGCLVFANPAVSLLSVIRGLAFTLSLLPGGC